MTGLIFPHNKLIMGGAVVLPPLSLALGGNASSGSDATNYTFNSVNIGAASADRLVIVGATLGGGGRAVNSISIAGIDGTLHAGEGDAWLASRVVASGTTGTIIVRCSGSTYRCGICVWVLKDYQSAIPTDTYAAWNNDMTIDVDAGGVICAVCHNYNTSAISWDLLTLNHDLSIEGSSRLSGASAEFASADTNKVVTPTFGTENYPTIAACSWR